MLEYVFSVSMSHFLPAMRHIIENSQKTGFSDNHKNQKIMLLDQMFITVAVLLPALIVWILTRATINKDNKNAEIIIKAIENNSIVDTDKLVKALSKRGKTPRQLLNLRLLRGCIFTFIGIAIAICIAIKSSSLPEIHIRYNSILLSGISLAIGFAYLVVYFVRLSLPPD